MVSFPDVQVLVTSSRGGRGGLSLPNGTIGLDLKPVQEAIRKLVAPYTWVNYEAAWRKWAIFVNGQRFSPRSPMEQVLLCFLASLMEYGYSYDHVAKVISGVSLFFRLMGLPSCMAFFSIKQALRGYGKAKFSPDGRWPISLELLADLSAASQVVCSYEALPFRTAFSLLFLADIQAGSAIQALLFWYFI